MKLVAKLQEYCQITWVTVVTFYHYIFVVTAIMFIHLHTFEQSCIWAYSRCTLLNHNIPLPSAERRIAWNKGNLEVQGHLKQLSSGEQNSFYQENHLGYVSFLQESLSSLLLRLTSFSLNSYLEDCFPWLFLRSFFRSVLERSRESCFTLCSDW